MSDIVCKKYGRPTLIKIHKYEKLDYKIGKSKLDISFLEACIEQDVMPNFVHFHTASKTLRNSDSYNSLLKNLIMKRLS